MIKGCHVAQTPSIPQNYEITRFYLQHKTNCENKQSEYCLSLFVFNRYLFWTDWGRIAKIERSTLNGGSRTTVVSGNLVWPNGIAIDYNSRMLVWVDAKLDKIETSDYNGNNRRVLHQQAGIHPFGVVVKRPFIYWTDWHRGLQQLDLSNNGTVSGHKLPGGTPFGISFLIAPTKNERKSFIVEYIVYKVYLLYSCLFIEQYVKRDADTLKFFIFPF